MWQLWVSGLAGLDLRKELGTSTATGDDDSTVIAMTIYKNTNARLGRYHSICSGSIVQYVKRVLWSLELDA